MNFIHFTQDYVKSMKSPVDLDACESNHRKLVSADPDEIRAEI